MPFVARSTDVLRILSFHPFPVGTAAIFDRGKTTAFITSFAMFIPTRHTAFSLDDIEAVQMQRRERHPGRFTYGLRLRRKRGKDIALRCRSRDDAMQFQRVIAEFLALP